MYQNIKTFYILHAYSCLSVVWTAVSSELLQMKSYIHYGSDFNWDFLFILFSYLVILKWINKRFSKYRTGNLNCGLGTPLLLNVISLSFRSINIIGQSSKIPHLQFQIYNIKVQLTRRVPRKCNFSYMCCSPVIEIRWPTWSLRIAVPVHPTCIRSAWNLIELYQFLQT